LGNTRASGVSRDGDDGFSLVEVLVALFLLAVLATSFLPLLVTTIQTTLSNAKLATATQLASRQLDALRAIEPYCDVVSAFDDTPVPAVADKRGAIFQATRVVGACPTVYPGLIDVTVAVTIDGEPGADAVTQVYLVDALAPVGP
jgi:prepilin-type N-terminal cleavage/methylation domain-containing protein